MVDHSRLEDLRRRVQKDPASIAFAQLAEEYRRARQYAESVDVCRAGLALHPGYLSARVTLGRALIELDDLIGARHELELVLKSAPDNLAALRGLADIHHKQGDLPEALARYKEALALARNDPDLEEMVNDLTRRLIPARGPDPTDSLSFDQMQTEFARRVPPPALAPAIAAPAIVAPAIAPLAIVAPDATSALQIAALEQWLAAIHVSRAGRRA
jgi:tetratricopeptide (TPR) repeat protein